MINLFSYGTLQKEKVQIELFGRLLNGSSDQLPGYKLSTVEIKDESVLQKSEEAFHPIAIATENVLDSIPGKVLEISPEELAMADSYETADYKRVQVKLQSGKSAFVYIAADVR